MLFNPLLQLDKTNIDCFLYKKCWIKCWRSKDEEDVTPFLGVCWNRHKEVIAMRNNKLSNQTVQGTEVA